MKIHCIRKTESRKYTDDQLLTARFCSAHPKDTLLSNDAMRKNGNEMMQPTWVGHVITTTW